MSAKVAPKIECPYCKETGQVRIETVKENNGFAPLKLLALGVLGGHHKVKRQRCTCRSCKAQWTM